MNMKNIIALIAAIIAAVSCTVDNVNGPSVNDADNDIYYASFEDCGAETRTYLDENVKLLWHADDRISLFRSTLNEQFKFTGATGDNSGGFSLIESDEWVTGNPTSTNYAVYPYDASARLSNEEVIHLNMPAVQNYAVNSFGRGANTMVAASENSSSKFLPFRNLGGYLIIKLYGENTTIKSIVLEGNKNEILAGPATAEAKYGYLPAISMSENGTKSITLDCGDGVELSATADSPTQFWMVVPPITFKEGFTFTITDINGNVTTKSTSKSQTIVRNEVKSMAGFSVTFEGEGEDPVFPADDEIYYTNGSTTESTAPSDKTSIDANIISNTYDAAKECWVIKFDKPITTIGERAFYQKSALVSITLPNSVTTIGKNAFYRCSALTHVGLPSGLISIDDYAFGSCYLLEDISLPDTITTIGIYAFSSCEALSGINLPDRLTYLGESAFSYCKKLEAITIPDGVKRINESTFSACNKLKEVTFGKGLTSIEGEAFYNCYELSNVSIPDGVQTIGSNAFYSCNSLSSIRIPSSITAINEHAFSGCSSLQRVDITDLSAWCKIAYETTSANPLCNGAKLFLNGDEVVNLTIPKDVTKVEFAQFYGCTSIKTITIGSHVTSLTNRTFAECNNLQSVTIENGITEIGYMTFYRCKSLNNIDIPQSVKSIGNYAFEECISLTELTIPDTVISIGDYAFRNCTSLNDLTIGRGVTSIGKRAFNYCAFGNIYCLATTPPSLNENVFYSSTSTMKIYVPASEDDSIINAYKASTKWSSYAYCMEEMSESN